MLTIIRMSKIVAVLVLVCGLFVTPCRADTAVSYSGLYTADLEQKQMFLESIKEDAGNTEVALRQESEKVKSSGSQNVSRLGLDRINLAEIMPASEKINIAFINMNGTLSPQRGDSYLPPHKDSTHE